MRRAPVRVFTLIAPDARRWPDDIGQFTFADGQVKRQ